MRSVELIVQRPVYCARIPAMLNRAALVVRPDVPFLQWAESLDDSGVVPDADGEQTVYLVPEFEFLESAQAELPEMFVEIFERELAGWSTDQETWPADRSLAVFQKWFKVEMHTVIEDLCADPLPDDELQD